MSVHRRGKKWEVRYRDGSRHRSKTFDRKGDADAFETEIRRRRQLGNLAGITAGTQTLDEYIETVWAPGHAALLAPKTLRQYSRQVDTLISPGLGNRRLHELTPDDVRAWQARCSTPADRPT